MTAALDPVVVAKAFGGEKLPLGPEGVQTPFRVARLGLIDVPSGEILAYEPFSPPYPLGEEGDDAAGWSETPLTVRAPQGAWPVDLAVAALGEMSDGVAFARLCWSDAPAAAWELAVRPGQDPGALGEDEIFGYPVDGGTGGFIDMAVAKAWDAQIETGAESDLLTHPDAAAFMDAASQGAALGTTVTLRGAPSWRFATFIAGWGDGVYATYVGRDASGTAVGFVTDFGLIAAPI